MPTILLLALLSLSHSALVDDRTYCAPRFNRLCQGKGRHVACQFPNPGAGPSCQNYTRIQFTSDLKHFLLHYINKRRQRVATGGETVRGGVRLPRPQIMMLVSWDHELATLAQRLADQCSFAHDECRATVRYPYPGQSIGEVRWRGVGGEAVALGVHRALRRVLDAWCGERRRVFARQLTAPFKLTRDMSWGHFSQLIVWRLSAVGCGATRHGDQRQRLLLVCDFSHTNMLGQRTIVPGPLAQCPTLTVRRPSSAYPLLCAPAKRATPAENYQESIKEYDYNIDTDSGEDDEGDRTTKVMDRTIENRKEMDGRSQLEIIQQEQDTKIKQYISESKPMNYLLWETTRQALPKSRKPPQIAEQAEYLKAKNKLPVLVREYVKQDDEEKLIASPRGIAHEVGISKGLISRQKWRPTRNRPQRPGAEALLHRSTESFLRRQTVVSFVLDKDDSDQLFRDTGFSVSWRKHTR